MTIPFSRYGLAFILLALPAVTHAQPSPVPREDFWTTDDQVLTVAVTNGIAYVGGEFRYVQSGYPVSDAQFSLISGDAEPDFPHANDDVWDVVPDGRGGWFVGGDFTRLGSVTCRKLAHILADRSVDPNWKPEPDNGVVALAVFENTLYVGGVFTNIAGQSRPHLAAFDINSGQLADWRPNVTHSKQAVSLVRSIAVTKETVYIGGSFDRVGGEDRPYLAALDPQTGKATSWRPAPDNWVVTIRLLGDRVFIGGDFTNLDGLPRKALAAVDRVTGRATPWNPGCDATVSTLYVVCDKVYAVGPYHYIGGQFRRSVAALDLETGQATDWDPQPDDLVQTLVFSGSTVFAGGGFTRIGGQSRNRVAALDLESGRATSWAPRGKCPVAGTLALSGRTLYVGGYYSADLLLRPGVAAFNLASGQPTAWNPIVNRNGRVVTLAVSGNTLYAGGSFSNVNGQARANLVALDTRTGNATAWNPGPNGGVTAVATSGNTVYVGGNFTRIGGQARSYIAALDAQTGSATDWNPAADGPIYAFAVAGNVVYAGGSFSRIGGAVRGNLAALSTLTGLVYSWWDPWTDDAVYALALSGTEVLYVGGVFGSIGGWPVGGIAAVNPITGDVFSWVASPDKGVAAMALAGDTLYVGGLFTQIGGKPRTRLAALDRFSSKTLDWNPALLGGNLRIWGVGAAGDNVVAGGVFVEVSQVPRAFLAVFPPAGSPQITKHPQSKWIAAGEIATLTVAASGVGPLTYQWQLNAANLPGMTQASLLIANATVADSGTYTVVVKNSRGQVSSTPATVTVIQPPVITVQPASQNVAPGAAATLSVTAAGSPAPLYQWRLNGVNLPDATESTLVFTNARPADSGGYTVVAANLGGAVTSETAELTVSAPALPFADNLADRLTTNSLAGVGRGRNDVATREPGEPLHAGKISSKSVWLGWRAPATGIVTFSTRGSAFDTLLAVYTNAPPSGPAAVPSPSPFASLGSVAGDDDRGGFLTSEVVFNAVAGIEYLVAVDGFGKASGNFVLSWDLEPGAAELARIFQQPLSQTVGAGENVTFAVTAFSSRPLAYQWFFNCLPMLGATNSLLSVPDVRPDKVGSYRVRVTDVNQARDSQSAYLQINATGDAGTVQKVASRDKLADRVLVQPPAVGLQSGRSDSGSARRALQSSLGGPGAGPARGFSGTQIFNTFGSTKEPGEPNHCGEPGGASQWFAILAEDTGSMLVSTEGSRGCDGCPGAGSDFDTVLAVYAGPENPLGFDELTLVGCDDNSGFDGKTSRLTFLAKKGQVYHVAVDGVKGARGRVELSYKLTATPVMTLLVLPQPPVGGFRLGVTNVLAGRVVIEAGGNLTNWQPIYTNPAAAGGFEFSDPASIGLPRRFYRAVK